MRQMLSLDPHGLEFVVLLDRQDYVHSLRDLSENRVDAVQMPLRRVADEELAAAGVLAGVGHGQRSRDVLVDVLLCLALDLVARAAGADRPLAALRVGVAALNHEVGDHTVKLGAVVEPGAGELLEVGDGIGHLIGEQLQLDHASRGVHHDSLIGHQVSTARLSSTWATVFMPTITVDTASLSSTNFRASWAAVRPLFAASSFTRWPRAVSWAMYGRGMRARMSPFSHTLSGAYLPVTKPLASGSRAITPTPAACAAGQNASSGSRRARLYTICTPSAILALMAASPSSGGCTHTP